jgi:dihydrofolate synthase/folylpolyglutamate synthase
VITSIGVDHVEFLGPTREHIGYEKAHIYRTGRPAVCSDPNPPESVLLVASELGAHLKVQGREFHGVARDGGWNYCGEAWRFEGLPLPALGGSKQVQNAAGVLAVLESLRDRCGVTEEAIRTGLRSVRLTGRFQKIGDHPETYVDVAHNPEAAAVLAESIGALEKRGRIHAVFGILRDKDCRGVIDALKPVVDVWHVASTHGPRGLDASVPAGILVIGAPTEVHTYPTVAEAHRAALAQAQAAATPGAGAADHERLGPGLNQLRAAVDGLPQQLGADLLLDGVELADDRADVGLGCVVGHVTPPPDRSGRARSACRRGW